jgi:hypothetical protein
MIAAKNPQIEKAVGILMDLSADERTRLLEESRQKALWDYNSRMKGAFDKGEAHGVQKGEARGRQDVISLLKSGKSPDEIIQMFDTAK